MRQHAFEERRSCIRTRPSTRTTPAAPLVRTCESRLCLEPKGRPVKSFRAKATSWIQNPLLLTNRIKHQERAGLLMRPWPFAPTLDWRAACRSGNAHPKPRLAFGANYSTLLPRS